MFHSRAARVKLLTTWDEWRVLWLIKLASCNKEDTSFFITCSSEWYTVLSAHAQARWSINQPLYHLPIPEPKYLKILTHTHKREVLKSS